MWSHPYGKTDLEAGARPLYPMMLESPATPVGLHSQGVFNLVLSITFNNRGGSSGCFYPSDFRLLFDYWGGVGALYSAYPHTLYYSVAYVLLSPETSRELHSARNFYHLSRLCCWLNLCLY
ncbi:hypothetical protein OIU78_012612 [Salix suchowensis]|nr:hypothetical protein OIU78_012612 [Salix suchowensis]